MGEIGVRLTKLGMIPTRGTPGSAGFDIYAPEDQEIIPGLYTPLNTGVQLTLPPGFYGEIRGRSGLLTVHGIEVKTGIIDTVNHFSNNVSQI